jgi:DNA-binding HxlR family transcriptional regulator
MPLAVRKSKVSLPPPACPLTECLALLGGAWTPNVIWHLSAGPRRFSELRIDIPRVSAKVLTARLRQLERRGVIERQARPTSPPSIEYSLTVLGQELVPAINAIVQVGLKLKQQHGSRAPDPRQQFAPPLWPTRQPVERKP